MDEHQRRRKNRELSTVANSGHHPFQGGLEGNGLDTPLRNFTIFWCGGFSRAVVNDGKPIQSARAQELRETRVSCSRAPTASSIASRISFWEYARLRFMTPSTVSQTIWSAPRRAPSEI
mgnify:CR=1 FL=1